MNPRTRILAAAPSNCFELSFPEQDSSQADKKPCELIVTTLLFFVSHNKKCEENKTSLEEL